MPGVPALPKPPVLTRSASISETAGSESDSDTNSTESEPSKVVRRRIKPQISDRLLSQRKKQSPLTVNNSNRQRSNGQVRNKVSVKPDSEFIFF